MAWTVNVTRKAQKQLVRLPKVVFETLLALMLDIELEGRCAVTGPIMASWMQKPITVI